MSSQADTEGTILYQRGNILIIYDDRPFVVVRGQHVVLSALRLKILKRLARSAPRTVPNPHLHATGNWRASFGENQLNLKVTIRYLRQDLGHPGWIVNIRKRGSQLGGYRLVVPSR